MSGKMGLVCNNCGRERKEEDLRIRTDKQGRPRYRICTTCLSKIKAHEKGKKSASPPSP